MKWVDRYLAVIVGVAILAVIISRRSTTPAVIQSFGAMLSNVLGSIVAPVSSGAAQAASAGGSAGATGASLLGGSINGVTIPSVNVTISQAQGATASATPGG